MSTFHAFPKRARAKRATGHSEPGRKRTRAARRARHTKMHLIILALALSALRGEPSDAGPSGSSAASASNANEIFDRALQAWRNRTYPPYLRYLVDVRAHV